MGMSASQSRLLAITARMHDIELRAQRIQNAKVLLGNQSDEVYAEYQKALEDTTFTATFVDNAGVRSDIPANFDNLFSSNRMHLAHNANYMLVNRQGELIVEQEIFDGYNDFIQTSMNSNDAYAFALYMMSLGTLNGPVRGAGSPTPNRVSGAVRPLVSDYRRYVIQTISNHLENDRSLAQKLECLTTLGGNLPNLFNVPQGLNDEDEEKYIDALRALEAYVFDVYGAEIYNNGTGEPAEDWDEELFNYYVNIFNAIQLCGGQCISINDYNSANVGAATTNGDWLQAMIECGEFTIYDLKQENREYSLNGVSVSASPGLAFTTTTQIDKTALAKAEAKYEHDMKLIDKKEQKYDNELAKIDTERNAIKTEMDSIKTVKNDNIEKTFNIFS
ncbi:MAG: hypothetical protein MJ237_02915 [bacterium]|nr:hypothetical protein [bacterium]